MKKWLFAIVGIVVVLLGWFFVFSQDNPNDINLLTYQEYINKFTLNLKTSEAYSIAGNNVNRRGIVRSFCNNIFLDPQLQRWFYQDESIHRQVFSPQDSMFLKIVCRNINADFGANSLIPDSVIKMGGVISWVDSNNKCARSTSMNSCNISMRFSDIFHTIVNDYTNIKIVWLFWNTKPDGSELEKQIQLWTNDYFGICDGKEGIYLNKNTNRWYCNHPNTYNMLSNFIKKLNNNLSKTVVVDFDGIYKIEWTGSLIKRSFVQDCNEEVTADRVWCWLNEFNNLIMNELMYYTMFLNFYKTLIPTSQQYLELKAGWSFADRNIELEQESFRASLEIDVANDSVWSTLRSIRNLYTWFPVHVWLVAYLEDLVRFRDELVDLYTPIHQTYYKFRNIQVPN